MVEWYNQKIQCNHMVTLWHFVTSVTAEIAGENLHFSGESFQ